MADVERVLAVANYLGEGPLWSSREQALYWVDITPGVIHRWQPSGHQHASYPLGFSVGCLASRSGGGLVLASKRGFLFWSPDTGIHPVANPIADLPDMRFNDGRVDPAGRFFAGTMQETSGARQPVGVLYRLDPDGELHTVLTGLGIPNGIGWSLDHKTMYFTDSPDRTIYAFDYDRHTGTVCNRRPFARIAADGGVPDGMTVDGEGCIWSAHWGAWRITRYDPDGKVERVISVPVERPTSCAFGGRNLDELYITSAALGMSEAERAKQPWAGDVLRLHVGVKGRPEYAFAG